MPNPNEQILAIDVGEVRVGLAIASTDVKLPQPLTTLKNDQNIWAQIAEIAKRHDVSQVVVGLPLGLNGQETQQTAYSREFGRRLEQALHLPVYFISEVLTSVEAEAELKSRGKPYQKSDIDALAAALFFEDFLNAQA